MSEMTMEAQALRRRIAEALGVKEIVISSEWVEYVDVGPVEIEVWRDERGHLIPDWPNDPGAALALMPLDCSLTRVDPRDWPQAWECTSDHPTERGEYPITITRYGPTPALAICQWFLAYQEAHHE